MGYDPETFLGPSLDFLTFAQFLIPPAVLEVYLRVQDGPGTRGKFAVAADLFVLSIAMGIGIFGTTMGMWLPRIQGWVLASQF